MRCQSAPGFPPTGPPPIMCGRIRVQPGEHTLLPYYQDSAKRALLKPEAVFEIESGLKLSGFDITAASLVRTEWYQSVRRLFERYDYVVAPTAQLFPFDVNMHWPNEIAGRRMETYHEWMKGMVLVTMSDVRRSRFRPALVIRDCRSVSRLSPRPTRMTWRPIGCLAGILCFYNEFGDFSR
jgi:hypothetical protein